MNPNTSCPTVQAPLKLKYMGRSAMAWSAIGLIWLNCYAILAKQCRHMTKIGAQELMPD